MLKYECDECGEMLDVDETIACAKCVEKHDERIAELETQNEDLITERDLAQEELDQAKGKYEGQIADLQGEVAELISKPQ